jgi:PAS domain S-box-containing protein
MSWVTIIWSMIASACLTLAVMHLLVWCRNRAAWANAAFALTALAMAGVVAGELWMMRAETVGEFGLALRWFHVPGWLLIVSLVGFVRVYLRAGRPWLAWAVCGVRTLSLILDFVFTPNLNYREITALRHIRFLGESVSVAEGVPNPWMLVGQAGFLLLAVFVVDAMIAVWRRDDWWRTRLLAGAIVFFVVAGAAQVVLALWGIIYTPLTPSLFFLGIVVSMAYEMSFDIRRAAQLSDDLRESEERMTLAAEATGVGVWMWSVARNQVWGSERWLRLFGFAPDEAVSFEKVMQRIHPDDRELVEQGVRRALADRSYYMADYRVVLPDGTQHWFVARGRVHPDANGKPARMLGTTIDITHRKRTELALGESELRYRTLFEAAPEGIALIGADGHIRAANPAQARLYGYESPQQLEGLYAPLCVAEKDRERSLQTMRDLLQGTELPVRRYTAVRRDGSEFIVEVTSAILRGPGREVIGYLCHTRDITVSKRVEAALKESEQRFRQVAETAGEFIWEVNAEGLYTYASPSVEKTLGYTAEELVGKKHFYDLFAPSVREERKAAAFQVFANRRVFRDFPNSNVSKSGKIVHLETSGTPVLSADGKLIGYRGADTDVTGRKQSDLEIAQQRNELAHLSRVSTMGVLTSSLAHELNQPLSAILNNAQAGSRFMAAATPDLAEVRGALEDIAEDAKRAGEVIRQMRALVRKDEPRLESLDLNRVISDVVRLLHSDLLVRKVQIALELAPELRPANGDNAQLQQVMLNLLLNAFDAMKDVPEGKRAVIVRTRQLDTASIRVEVRDGGTGISPDRLVNLFEPFRSSKREGLGLGLSISRSIVEAHKGRLWAENNPDCGAIFYFTLPVHEPELNLT